MSGNIDNKIRLQRKISMNSKFFFLFLVKGWGFMSRCNSKQAAGRRSSTHGQKLLGATYCRVTGSAGAAAPLSPHSLRPANVKNKNSESPAVCVLLHTSVSLPPLCLLHNMQVTGANDKHDKELKLHRGFHWKSSWEYVWSCPLGD